MSRTVKGSKGPGYDYNSRRHPSSGFCAHGAYVKRTTHRYERRRSKAELDHAEWERRVR